MSKRIQYRVRPVTRYVVTRHTEEDKSSYGKVETLAIFDSETLAHETAAALAQAVRAGISPGPARGRIDMATDGDQPIENLGIKIAAMACQIAAGKDLLFAGLTRQDGGWRLKFVDDFGSGGAFELSFTDRQVSDDAAGGGLRTLIAERVECWLATCSPRGRLLQ